MDLPPACRYTMKILSENKRIVFRDRKRRRRLTQHTWLDKVWNCDLIDHIPNSKFICDKNGDIYLMFDFGDRTDLLKFSMHD